MKTPSGPRIIFPEGFDERAAFETPLKGWLNAQIELEDSCRYTVYFCDPSRLQQDLDEAIESERPCFAEPGPVIVPELSMRGYPDEEMSPVPTCEYSRRQVL